jgi:hypothetical protein
MRFAGFSAFTLLLASSSAIPTKRQALIDSIGGSSLDDVMAEIKNNGNIALLGDLLEIAVDALSTEASAVAECYNPAASSALGAGASGSGSGSLGSGGLGAGVGGGAGADSPAASAAVSQLSSLLSSVASAATAAPDAANGLGDEAAAAASSALNFLSTANPAASVAPAISSLLSSIADNAAIPTGAASSLVDAASGAPSQLSSILDSIPTAVGQDAAAAASSALGFLSTANPAASVGPAISSLLSSIAANPAPTNAASSLTDAASSVIGNLPGVSAGAGIGAGVGVGGGNGNGNGGSPAFSSLVSSLANDPAVTGAPALSSAIASLTNPAASIGSSLASDLSSVLANPSTTLPSGVISSLISAISSAANNGGVTVSPVTNTRDPASSSSSTPIVCPFTSESKYIALGSEFTRYCNQFYGGNVLTLGNSVLKRQAVTSLNGCANICSPNARCLGTSYDPKTGSCTFYSSLTNGVTRNGIQFAVRSSAASTLLPPVSVSATAGASGGVSIPISSIVNAGSTTSRLTLPSFSGVPTVGPIDTSRLPSQVSSILGGLTSATSLGSSVLSSIASEITALPTSVLPSGVASSLASEITGITSAVNPTSAISSILSEATNGASSIINVGTTGRTSIPGFSSVPIISGVTSGVGSITSAISIPTGVTLPPGVSVTSITTSCGGALVNLCATLGIGNSATVNLGVGGNAGATPTTFSAPSGVFTATSTKCSGLVCLAIGLGPSATATLGVLNPADGSILDLGLGAGATPTVTGVPSITGITSTIASCNGLVCLALGVGPSATVTLGALNSDGSIIDIGAGVTPAITASSVPTTLPGGAVITTTSASCNGVLCLALGVGPSTTVTLGALNTDGSIVSLGVPSITSVTVVPTSTAVGSNTITAIRQSCTGSGLLRVCINLGLGPLGSVTLGANALPTSGGLISAGLSASLPVASAALTVPAVLATPLTISDNTITAVSTSCTGAVVPVCVTLGLGNLGTVTLDAGVLPTSGGVISASGAASVGASVPTVSVPTVSASVSGSAGVSIPTVTVPAVIPTSTVIGGATYTGISSSCSGALLNLCVTVALGSAGAVTLDAGVLPTNGGVVTASLGASASAIVSAGASGAVTIAPTLTRTSVVSTTRVSTSCTGGLLGVPLVCATLNIPGVATVSVVAREATTLATVVRK